VEPRNTFTLYSEAEGKVIQSAIILGNKVNKGQNILSIDASLRSANKNIIEQNIIVKFLFDDKIITYNYNNNTNSKLLRNYIDSNIDANNFVIDLQIIYCYENN
jgi:multidrug efflux pump subunit AcrA (membrane-fusion protein)